MRRNRLFGTAMASSLLVSSVLVAAPATAQDPVTLDFWVFGDMGLGELVTQYQTEHPNVTINFLERGYAEHHDALLAALATGEVPDIAAIEVGYMSKFKAQPENFVNLLDYGAADLEKDYLPWRWEQAVSADGSSVIGIPTDVGGMATCYRADLFEAAGLPTDPAEVSALWPDWESFIATGKKYTDATGKAFIDSARGSVFNLVARQGDEEYYKTGDPNTTVYADNPQVKKAWDLSVAAVDAGISANIDQFSPEWNAGMANGDFAVLGCPAWMMGYIQGQAPDTAGKWNIAGIPEKAGNWGGTHLTIPVASDQHDAAAEFIKWVLSPENQLEVFKLHGNFPSTPALYTTPEIQDYTNDFFSGAPVGKIYSDSVAALKPIFEGVYQREIDVEFGNGLGRIEDGTETAEAAWASTMSAIDLAIN